MVTIGLERTFYTAGEGDGVVTVCAIIVSGELARSATVELSTQDNTATGTYVHTMRTPYSRKIWRELYFAIWPPIAEIKYRRNLNLAICDCEAKNHYVILACGYGGS